MSVPHTIRNPFSIEGVGIHTGTPARVDVSPAPAGHGRVFIRNGICIPALTDYVVDTRRCTTLGYAGAQVSTVEHLLAACMLAGIHNIEVHVDGPELPVLDGATEQWYQAILQAGVCPQEGELTTVFVQEPRWVKEGDAEFFLTPSTDLSLFAAIAIPDTVATQMIAGGQVRDDGVRMQIARARTYGLQHEVQALLDAGLAQGGSLDNAVILTPDGYMNRHVWPAEPAWHKVLDLLGDLALVGAEIAGHILAVRAGHRSHIALARILRAAFT